MTAAGDYRQRIYARYASVFKVGSEGAADAVIDRWGSAYDAYLAGWLPASQDAAIADLACGPGWLLRFFAKHGVKSVVVSELTTPICSTKR